MKKNGPEAVLAVTAQAPGAMPNGTRVVKLPNPHEQDRHQPGALATVIGSLANNGAVKPRPGMPEVAYMYCVIWDDTPGVPVFCADFKLGLASDIERPN